LKFAGVTNERDYEKRVWFICSQALFDALLLKPDSYMLAPALFFPIVSAGFRKRN